MPLPNMERNMEAPSATDSNEKYSVFFSHKVNDKTVTGLLIDLLDRHTEHVNYFVSEDIEKGVPWRKTIAEHLNLSSFLVLVFTDPTEDWGWCLYETGFFDALSQIPDSKSRRIYCLHNASTAPPSPIADLQTIPATHKDVAQWLSELFTYTKQTKPAFWQDIPKLADKICELFANNQKPIYSQRSIDIIVNCTLLTSPDDLPEDTTIEGEERLIEELFGTYSGRTDWKTARERFYKFPNSTDVNINTLKEISRAVYGIYNRSVVHPVQGVIFVDQGPKRYRPVINRAKELTKGRIGCEILLIEEVGGQLQNVDKPLGALLTSIRMAVRIRWEIVRPFASNVGTLARLNARKLRFDLQTCFNNVFLEAEFRGYYSPEDVLNAFESVADKAKFMEIIGEFGHAYPKIWEGIGFLDVTETFGEVSEQPMSDRDISLLDSGLQVLERVNKDFLGLAVARARVLVQRELRVAITARRRRRATSARSG